MRNGRSIEEKATEAVGEILVLTAVLDVWGKVVAVDPVAVKYAGLDTQKVIGTHLADTFWWNFSTSVADALRQDIAKARSGRASRRTTVIRSCGAERLPVLLQCKPHIGPAGKVDELVVVALCLSAEDAAAGLVQGEVERLSTINRELVHRVKNLFSVVLAALSISYRHAASREDLLEMASSRIAALSKAHLLSVDVGDRPPTTSVSLEELIRAIVGPYLHGDGVLTMRGDPVQVQLRDLTPLTLILHELATNSTKYGALSQERGKLEIRWECIYVGVSEDCSFQLKTLIWKEEFSVTEVKGSAVGFGALLLERCIKQMEGEIETRQTPSSYSVTIGLQK